MPETNEFVKADRYFGQNDPVAHKILSGDAEQQALKPPEDESVMSLFLSSLPASAMVPPDVHHNSLSFFFH